MAPVYISETGVTCKRDCLINKLVCLHISIDCFGISIDCFGLSRIKKWMILIITVNLSTGSSKMRRQSVCSAEQVHQFRSVR